MKKIFMFTSVHNWNDTRIFHKEAVSLAKKYEVELHAPADFDYKEENGVKIYGLPKWKKRIDRIKTILILFYRTFRSNADVFHFHDPELIFIGLFIKIFKRKIVIYDIHENVKKQILNKEDIKSIIIKRMISYCYSLLEIIVIHSLNKIIVAGEDILSNFDSRIIINNFSIINKKKSNNNNNEKESKIVYLGGVTKIRGVEEVARAIEKLNNKNDFNLKFKIVGKFDNLKFKNHFLNKYGNFVDFLGWKKQKEAYDEAVNSIVGVVLYLPRPNHMKLRSNKVFEYMECGIPIIYSNFPDWKGKLDKYKVGLSVNPTDIKEIANAIEYLLNNPEIAKQMGENGRRAVEEKFNWRNEERKLWSLYENL